MLQEVTLTNLNALIHSDFFILIWYSCSLFLLYVSLRRMYIVMQILWQPLVWRWQTSAPLSQLHSSIFSGVKRKKCPLPSMRGLYETMKNRVCVYRGSWWKTKFPMSYKVGSRHSSQSHSFVRAGSLQILISCKCQLSIIMNDPGKLLILFHAFMSKKLVNGLGLKYILFVINNDLWETKQDKSLTG